MDIVKIKIYTAKCNWCGCRFEWIPFKVNSTKSRDYGGVPRCPVCHKYRQTVVCEETR